MSIRNFNLNNPMGLLNVPNTSSGLLNLDQNQIQQAINQKAIDDANEIRKQEDQKFKLQNLADTFGMVNARKSGNYGAANTINQRMQQRKEQFENNRKMQQAFSNNPELLNIYNTFGRGAAFQEMQRLRNAEINAANEQRKRQGLKDAGFSDREIGLFINADMSASDIMALRDTNTIKKSIQQLDNEVKDEYVSSEGLEVIDQGFSLKDTIDDKANKFLGPVFGTVAKETQKAVSAKKVLNENLRERFVNQYSGRPSVYLNQRIDALLPQGVYLDEEAAFDQYTEIRRVLGQAKIELTDSINSGVYKGGELDTLQKEYKSTSKLLRDLDTVIGNLAPPPDKSLKADQEAVTESETQNTPNRFGDYFGVSQGNTDG